MEATNHKSTAHIWVLPLIAASDLATQNSCIELLSELEKQQYKRFILDTDRLSYLTAHAAIRLCLSEHATTAPDKWIFAKKEHGQPFIKDCASDIDLRFSISHCRQKVTCMVTRGIGCGVDIERIGRTTNIIKLASRFFSPQETAYLLSLNHKQRKSHFTALWTLKEAYTKAIGLGLSFPFSSFSFDFSISSADHIVFHAPDGHDADQWNFHLEQVDSNHWLAAAVCNASQLSCYFKVQKFDYIDELARL